MKTSVELLDEKVALAKKMTESKTLKELLDKALDALIQQARRKSMLELLGTGYFVGDLKKMRGKKSNAGR